MEELTPDDIAAMVAALEYYWQKDSVGNQVMELDFDNGRCLVQILKALPLLIEEVRDLRHLAYTVKEGSVDQIDDALQEVQKYLK